MSMETKIGKICSFALTVLLVYNATSQFSTLLELITSASTVFLAKNDDRYRSVFVRFSLVIYANYICIVTMAMSCAKEARKNQSSFMLSLPSMS